MPSERYSFRATNSMLAEASLLPMLPLVLSRAERNGLDVMDVMEELLRVV